MKSQVYDREKIRSFISKYFFVVVSFYKNKENILSLGHRVYDHKGDLILQPKRTYSFKI